MTKSNDEIIWRYLTLGKLIDLLEYQELFLCRANLFEDSTEGEWFAHMATASMEKTRSYFNIGLQAIRRLNGAVDSENPATLSALEKLMRQTLSEEEWQCLDDTDDLSQLLDESICSSDGDRREWLNYIEEKHAELVSECENTDSDRETLKEEITALKGRSYVSSWFGGNSQSMAMWKMYCPGSEGVAVTTTKRKLHGLIADNADLLSQESATGFSFDVVYIDSIDTEVGPVIPRHLPDGVWMSYRDLMLKHAAFDYEKEFRLVVKCSKDAKDRPSGIKLPIVSGMNEFIDQVHLPPTIDEHHWMHRVVATILDRFSLSTDKMKIGRIRTSYSGD